MRSPKVSIALCTYNGARYLGELLDSIAKQTLPPAELVACDDGSTDNTVELLEGYAQRVPFNVRIVRNPRNLGSNENFAQAISLCTTDVIALCDQDDVWEPNKLEVLAQKFRDHPEVAFVFSDARLIDSLSNDLGERLWPRVGFPRRGEATDRPIDLFCGLVDRCVVTGATMAFRSELRDIVMPISQLWVHDGWIAINLAFRAPCLAISDPLISYRQHSAQQIGAPTDAPTSWRPAVRETRRLLVTRVAAPTKGADCTSGDWLGSLIRSYEAVLAQVLTPCTEPDDELQSQHLAYLREKLLHLNSRLDRSSLLVRGNRVLRELASGRYHRHSLGWLSAGRDLLGL